MADIYYDAEVDVTDKVSPYTFVKAKVALDELEEGEVLAIRLNDGESLQNVPRSFREEKQEVLDIISNGDGTFTLYVRKLL